MKIILCIVSVLFGGLSLLAAAAQLKGEKKSPSGRMMAAGSLVLLAAVLLNIFGQKYDAAAAVLGCVPICAAAIMNGIKSKNFHILHHVIRIALSIILILGFAVL